MSRLQFPPRGPLAQLVEQGTLNPKVEGSNPSRPIGIRHRSTLTLDVDTPQGRARVHLHATGGEQGALVLGHGAGGGVSSSDLVVARDVARSCGYAVALVEQPYRVRGRRSPPPAQHLDTAWEAVVARLADRELQRMALVVGGRSSGARVACRTAAATGAVGVLCLAFPLQPRRKTGPPRPSRLPELDAVSVPTLVVQGAGDPFGIPPDAPTRRVVVVAGNHSLRSDRGAISDAIKQWLPTLIPHDA